MSTKFKSYSFEVPKNVTIDMKGLNAVVKSGSTELIREVSKFVVVKQENTTLTVSASNKSARSRILAGTYASHIKNMIAGVQKPYVYKLKIVGTHFPITVNQSGEELLIQNFLGEKKPRKAKLANNVSVKIQGDIITVESADIEKAGMVAARIEQATTVRGKDRRIFQDGIYLFEKAGQAILK
ncbi:MAG: 50S ribosomal protein L6 [DPANN group archaeon]|nr:50S ribosomal protein L6P [uncultured archaeon]MBS3064246.1 50S ribosomal protein L6 [DPANN group archaeon]